MKSSAQVVVIGGGVVGASVLYHLTKAGWTDVVLVERRELTSGSTWHAAGGMHTLNGDPNVSKLQQYTIELYKEIEAASGQDCSIHLPGGLMLADTRERLDWLRMAQARGRYLGMELEIITAAEAKDVFPLMEDQYFVGALFDPVEGHVDPTGVTNAYAMCARKAGAEVERHTMVTDLRQRADGTWDVITDRGEIHAEHIVNAGGLWAREVGRMIGIELPVLAMEHMYLVTEPMAEVADHNARTGREMPMALDFAGEIYIRQEQGGMLLGTYEQACVPWSPQDTPWDFEMQLLEPDLDRIAPSLEVAFKHYPAMATAGIKSIINGPFTFSPDGNPLVGPVRGIRNCWVACAVMAGLSQGGGVGLALATWMTEGDPGLDIWGMDVAALRRLRHAGLHQRQGPGELQPPVPHHVPERGAAGGPPPAHHAGPRPTHRAQRRVGRVVRAGARAVVPAPGRGAGGGGDVPPVQRLPPGGRGVRGGAGAGRPDGDVELRQVPRDRAGGGRVAAESLHEPAAQGGAHRAHADAQPPGPHRGRVLGGTRRRRRLLPVRFPGRRVPSQPLVHRPPAHRRSGWTRFDFEVLALSLVGLSVAGPRARDVLQSVTKASLVTEDFPFMAFRRIDIGMIPAWVGRMTYSGDLGYELWVRPEEQGALFDLLWSVGQPHGMRLFGFRALMALRMEKSFGTWFREYRPIYTPLEAGMERYLKLDHDFIGREALEAEMARGPERRLVTLVVEPHAEEPADVIGDEPIWHDGAVVGWVTSGAYAHHSGVSLALGYVPAALAETGTGDFEIEIIGHRCPAHLQPEPVFDPEGLRMRT